MSRIIVRLKANRILQKYGLSNSLGVSYSISIQHLLQVTTTRNQEASLASVMLSTLRLTCTVTSGTVTSETNTLPWNVSVAKLHAMQKSFSLTQTNQIIGWNFITYFAKFCRIESNDHVLCVLAVKLENATAGVNVN